MLCMFCLLLLLLACCGAAVAFVHALQQLHSCADGELAAPLYRPLAAGGRDAGTTGAAPLYRPRAAGAVASYRPRAGGGAGTTGYASSHKSRAATLTDSNVNACNKRRQKVTASDEGRSAIGIALRPHGAAVQSDIQHSPVQETTTGVPSELVL